MTTERVRGSGIVRGSGPSSVSTFNTLSMPVKYVKGVGERMASVLGKLGIFDVRDLLYHFPRRHEDRSQIARISSLRGGEEATICGRIVAVDNVKARSGLVLTKVAVDDGSGIIMLTWFNQPYLRDRFLRMRGREIIAFGMVQGARWGFEINTPEWEEFKENADPLSTSRIVPIYPLTEGVFQSTMRRIVSNALDGYLDLLPEILPEGLRKRLELADAKWAVRNMHFPDSMDALAAARRRLVFEELYVLQLALALRKREISAPGKGIAFKIPDNLIETLHEALPFELTGAQQRVIQEIAGDMSKPECMNRLLQGDVGSGKTAVALAAILICVRNGRQAALMAPTEILAVQHYLSLSDKLDKLGISAKLLIGGLSAKEKRDAQEQIASGDAQLVIGTHALIQEGVEFADLGLVIVDEQHRFGVLQRAALREKGLNPDVLVMTATPIPRTLTLTVYGDLEVSIIDELPPGRIAIRTHWKATSERAKVYEGVRKLVSQGRQAYVVCPLIEESEKLQVRAATELYAHLASDVFPDFRVGLIHGQMKTAEKDAVMHAFRAGEIDVLVATTVIEVGVDVPNATVMVIEDADRFGLAQLHQLRGRVGRGDEQSFCVLIGDGKTEDAAARLRIMTQTTDGFAIAEEDLRIRGPGEFYGTRQSGMPVLTITDIFRDIPILELARKEAFEAVERDPELMDPEMQSVRIEAMNAYEKYQLVTVS